MSLTNPKDVVTEERLAEFYGQILPYLGGGADAGFTPVGTIISVMGVNAPANYLACNGQVVNIADYPELSDYFYQQFGSKNKFGGNGTTTFGIPDLRGEFLRGTGTNSHSGQGNGANVGIHQDASEFPQFGVNPGNGTSDGSDTSARIQFKSKLTSGNTWQFVNNRDSTTMGTGALWQNSLSSNSGVESTSGSQTFTTRPTNTSVLYCIATKNIYLNPSLDYSTTEKVVGTWIDGKPLYQKTVTDTFTETIIDGTTNTHSIDISSLNIDEIITVECESKMQSGFHNVPTIYVANGTVYYMRYYTHTSNNTFNIEANRSSMTGAELKITIKYTKATD